MSALRMTRGHDAARAARTIVCDQFCVQAGETVLVTADSSTDPSAVDAVLFAAAGLGAKTLLLSIPQLPFQGKLADPYIPDALTNAASSSDVWFDMTWPYLAGSSAHARSIEAGRVRYMLLGDLSAESLQRLYGTAELDRLFAVQSQFDDLIEKSSQALCRVTSPRGTDITFCLGKPAGRKTRHVRSSGSSTPLGSCIFYPNEDGARGTIVLDAIFHEYYAILATPIRLHIDGEIREVECAKDQALILERSLRRAGGGSYGRVVHFSCGFHPMARFTGNSFIEDIRTIGANAIGLGVPWWEPGGGENHPDAIVTQQSLWIDDQQIVRDGSIVAPAALLKAAEELSPVSH